MNKKIKIDLSIEKDSASEALVELRKKLGWPQARLAKEWKVHPGTISLWEVGSRSIPGPVLRLIEIYSNYQFE
jgi:DNA-binding transcriptional regulator YiaG